MSPPLGQPLAATRHWQIRVRGTVQGVGFRPSVWRLAERFGVAGEVLNDGEGVLIRLDAHETTAQGFLSALATEAPPLAVIDSTELEALPEPATYHGFRIVPSAATGAHTPVTPDAYTCAACLEEVSDPFERRYRYPFTNCTHCGPRFSIVRGIPYDRPNTTMAPFEMCEECRAEYEDPADRRFHAQPIACHACGPKAWLVRTDGRATSFDQHSMLDDVDAVAGLIGKGQIVAIRGVGGFHLACDATSASVVEELRRRKHRDAKPFALMARDLDVIRTHCRVSHLEERLLASAVAPIVLLERRADCALPEAIAPGLTTLGFMLPTSPLHHLILRRFDRPVVMTSGNLSSEPQVTDNAEVSRRLGGIADYALLHDR
ncbi:MAG: carbamoyltransferase HypF, partial [Acidobacteria bacterium]|nr:carbamoyltransferase HypF [Acidobacteriota bacterium]